MAEVSVLVLRAAGINCDEEVVHAWKLAGAKATLMHVNQLAARPDRLDSFQIVTIPGGFSYGDDIAAGTILGQRLRLELGDAMHRFVDRGGGIIGICNGFQVLIKAGLLPGGDISAGRVTLAPNDSGRFEARWVRLEVCTRRCPYLKPSAHLEMPVEHAEGKFVTASDTIMADLEAGGRIALRYVDNDGRHDRYPANPNGSASGVAGLCDPTGRVLGLMPHPDRNFDFTQHPLWTRRKTGEAQDGLTIFQNAVTYFRADRSARGEEATP